MAEFTFTERVDDAILCAAWRLSKLRQMSLRGGLMDFRATCQANGGDSRDTPDEDIWRIRIDRCDQLLLEPEDARLKQLALKALEREK